MSSKRGNHTWFENYETITGSNRDIKTSDIFHKVPGPWGWKLAKCEGKKSSHMKVHNQSRQKILLYPCSTVCMCVWCKVTSTGQACVSWSHRRRRPPRSNYSWSWFSRVVRKCAIENYDHWPAPPADYNLLRTTLLTHTNRNCASLKCCGHELVAVVRLWRKQKSGKNVSKSKYKQILTALNDQINLITCWLFVKL